MDRLSSHFLRPSPTRFADGQSALVVKLGVSPSRFRLPGPHLYNSGIVQQAKGRSSETAVSPHHNNQSAICNLQTSIPFSCGMKLAYKGYVKIVPFITDFHLTLVILLDNKVLNGMYTRVYLWFKLWARTRSYSLPSAVVWKVGCAWCSMVVQQA
jgi:hypothetical protein